MTVRVLQCAELELAEAVAYYEGQRRGLGRAFAIQVKAAFDRIEAHPGAWPPFTERTRRCIVSRFPYGVLYQVRDQEILILAVMHLHRDPRRWQERLAEAPDV